MDQYITNIQANILPQVKFWHWQTTAHASHVALGELYDALADTIDAVVESWQGRTGTRIVISGPVAACVDFENATQAIELLGELVNNTIAQVDDLRKLEAFGDIINLLEELTGTLGKTMYLLTLT